MFEAGESFALDAAAKASSRALPRSAAKRLGLRYVTTDKLTIRRRRRGETFTYVSAEGSTIRDPAIRMRLKGLAVPPAYEDVLYAEDPAAHIQAIGRDAAGRRQYRYHASWREVRETHKARRLTELVAVLPKIRRAITKHLSQPQINRAFALSAVIDLVERSAIRPGRETYARLNGTRGAATLLKSNVVTDGGTITLKFRAKGGKDTRKQLRAPRLAAAIEALRKLPGRRLFQYRDGSGALRIVKARDVNAFLREMAGTRISLKDLRTLCASAAALDALARIVPASNERTRRRQVREAVTAVSEELGNTPTICRTSYVHDRVVTAFESGELGRLSAALKSGRGSRGERLLAKVVGAAT